MVEIGVTGKRRITSPQEEEGKQRWHIVQLICGYTGILVVVYGLLFYAVSREWLILAPAIGFCVLFFSVKWFTGKENYRLTGFMLQIVYCLVMLYYGIILGNVAQVQYLSIFMISISALLFRPDDKKLIYGSALLPVVCLTFLELNYSNDWIRPLFFSYQQEQIFRWLILFVVILLNFILLSMHQQKLVGMLRKSRELFYQLDISHQELLMHSESLEQQVLLRTEELNKLIVQLQGANRLKTAFLQENNHEVRNPVNSILGFTERLLKHKKAPFLNPLEEQELIECIYSSGQHLRNVVSNVLDYSRLEAGRELHLYYEEFDVREWLQKSVLVYGVMARERKINIHQRVDENVPATIKTDKTRITQVFFNLMGNAFQFTPRNKSIYIHCWVEDNRLMLKIRDEGTGIAAGRIGSIFNEYETAYHKGGAGLGLGIVRKLLDLLEGDIEVSSVEGEGSIFRINIPLQPR